MTMRQRRKQTAAVMGRWISCQFGMPVIEWARRFLK